MKDTVKELNNFAECLCNKYQIADSASLKEALMDVIITYDCGDTSPRGTNFDSLITKLDKLITGLDEQTDIDPEADRPAYLVPDDIDILDDAAEVLRRGKDRLQRMREQIREGRPSNERDATAAYLLIKFWIEALGRKFNPNFISDGHGGYLAKSDAAQFLVEVIQFVAQRAYLWPEQQRRVPDVGSIRKTVERVRDEHFPETKRKITRRTGGGTSLNEAG